VAKEANVIKQKRPKDEKKKAKYVVGNRPKTRYSTTTTIVCS